jgi:hypothetical protein
MDDPGNKAGKDSVRVPNVCRREKGNVKRVRDEQYKVVPKQFYRAYNIYT